MNEPKLMDYAGQTALLPKLIEDFRAGQFVHAYLFLGPEGVGKFSVATLLAMVSVCRGQDKPCGKCGPCIRVKSHTHPDVYSVTIGKSMGVDEVRKLIERVQVRAYEGGTKAIILQGADKMTVQAQNCLLKTLEEPPENTVFFLTAKSRTALLTTICSRCRLVNFHPLSLEDTASRLVDLGIEKDRSMHLAHAAEGSVGKALQIDQDKTYFSLLERVDRALFATKRLSNVCMVSAQFKDEKDNAERILNMAEQLFRDAMRLKLLDSQQNNLGYSQEFFSYVSCTPTEVSVRMLEAVIMAKRMRASNVTFAAVWEKLLLVVAEEYDKWQW